MIFRPKYKWFKISYLEFFSWKNYFIQFFYICPDVPKRFSLFKFSSKHVLFGARKNICTAPFIDAHELHSCSTLKANAFIFLYISLTKFLFHRRSKVLSGGRWDGGRLNNFFKAVRCLGLAKCFTIFHFNWNFWKFNLFLAFRFFYL